jgi:hypothetical protein
VLLVRFVGCWFADFYTFSCWRFFDSFCCVFHSSSIYETTIAEQKTTLGGLLFVRWPFVMKKRNFIDLNLFCFCPFVFDCRRSTGWHSRQRLHCVSCREKVNCETARATNCSQNRQNRRSHISSVRRPHGRRSSFDQQSSSGMSVVSSDTRRRAVGRILRSIYC